MKTKTNPQPSKSNSNTADIRQSFLDFFTEREHKLVASSPVIPFDDPTLLFTNAGMNQFKKVFTGEEKPQAPRAVSVQKCIRAGGKHNDLENVGFTTRHHTFFEMLGNFSFGDYFKEEAISYAWELLTKVYELDQSRLYATVYSDDDEAFELWEKIAPELKDGRILRFGKEDNYWSMGEVGPCGPCSEIHYDRGERFGKLSDGAGINKPGERFVEIWNLVFMQYNQREGADKLEPLPKPSVDTGAGLERIACVMQDCDSNYDIDLFQNIIREIENETGIKYSSGDKGASHRVLADHVRALTFAIADGAGISNEGQGYVLRRILRRASRHARLLGCEDALISRLVPALVAEMENVYPEIKEKRAHIVKVIRAEEESFGRTLDTGLRLFATEAAALKDKGESILPGEVAFKLYDTHGFPVDMTEVMARENSFSVDMEGFEREMEKQRQRARSSTSLTTSGMMKHLDDMLKSGLKSKTPTKFDRETSEKVAKVIDCKITEPGYVAIVLNHTPFYVEAGGQVSDTGFIYNDSFKVNVTSMHNYDGYYIHTGKLDKGSYSDVVDNTSVTASINQSRRIDIMRNHTATHLMHAALRKILGEHVKQSGSLVSDEKLRFDFSHFEALTNEQLMAVEKLVNDKILESIEVAIVEMQIEEAQKTGAMALFGEKYGDLVRVVSIGDFSKELCGGTHVSNTSSIGPFMITMEGGIASGVRRIEALTGRRATERALRSSSIAKTISNALKLPEEEIVDGVSRLQKDNAKLQKEIKKIKSERFAGGASAVGDEIDVGEFKLISHDFSEVEMEALTGWMDAQKSRGEKVIAAGLGLVDSRRVFVMGVSSAAMSKGAHAGKIAKDFFEQAGGRGGGRDNFAQGVAPADVESAILFSTLRKIVEEISA